MTPVKILVGSVAEAELAVVVPLFVVEVPSLLDVGVVPLLGGVFGVDVLLLAAATLFIVGVLPLDAAALPGVDVPLPLAVVVVLGIPVPVLLAVAALLCVAVVPPLEAAALPGVDVPLLSLAVVEPLDVDVALPLAVAVPPEPPPAVAAPLGFHLFLSPAVVATPL